MQCDTRLDLEASRRLRKAETVHGLDHESDNLLAEPFSVICVFRLHLVSTTLLARTPVRTKLRVII